MFARALIIIFILCGIWLPAQTPDTTKAIRIIDSGQVKPNKKELYSKPRRASILSAVLPGAGQVYNKKYWKVPVIYAGLGGFGYWFYVSNYNYNYYRKAELKAVDSAGYAYADGQLYATEDLSSLKFKQKKYRDYAFIGMAAVYLLNIIDANVDAHLTTFDVSDDLSLHIEPWQKVYALHGNRRTIMGLSLRLNFK